MAWLAIAVLGFIIKARKKANGNAHSSHPHNATSIDEILEHIQQQAQHNSEQPKATKADVKSAPQKKRFTPADEGIASTTPADTTSEAKPKKGDAAREKDGKMDFDPVDMVIYSEIMKPGYEKY